MTSERELMDEIARLKAKISEYEMAAFKEMQYAVEAKKLRKSIPVLPYREFLDANSTTATLTAENERLSARVARLEAALKPFDDFAQYLEIETEGFMDDEVISCEYRGDIATAEFPDLKFGDFRTARRELEEGHD